MWFVVVVNTFCIAKGFEPNSMVDQYFVVRILSLSEVFFVLSSILNLVNIKCFLRDEGLKSKRKPRSNSLDRNWSISEIIMMESWLPK